MQIHINKFVREYVENIKLAPDALEVEITCKIPKPVVDVDLAGAYLAVIHNLLKDVLVRRYVLKRKGRRLKR